MSEFREILIPLDNSKHSRYCIHMGIRLAGVFHSRLVGNHIYAARLHEDRFSQMESSLPDRYVESGELEEQKKTHNALINDGLKIISESFLDFFGKECAAAKIPFTQKSMEGKNYYQLVKDIHESDYSLVIMGAFGLGALHRTLLGSVTSRVVRRSRADVLVVRQKDEFRKKIAVCVDGSPKSFAYKYHNSKLTLIFIDGYDDFQERIRERMG